MSVSKRERVAVNVNFEFSDASCTEIRHDPPLLQKTLQDLSNSRALRLSSYVIVRYVELP